ncbi:hypothetical protein LZ32DRAFT_620386 [Colletotrichum eremochloae]|nr:hypothetical protein LZ32DRAFT_620386 [Colletotrichum eremochloae]
MYPTYPLLVLLWPLLSYTCAAARGSGDPTQEKGLRSDTDIYTVETYKSTYRIFSPYYEGKESPIAHLRFPTENSGDEIKIFKGWDVDEETSRPHKLRLSEIIKALASTRYANRPLESFNSIRVWHMTHRSLDGLARAYAAKHGVLPTQLTIRPRDPLWPDIEAMPLYKAIRSTFKNIKTIKTVRIHTRSRTESFQDAEIWFNLEDS